MDYSSSTCSGITRLRKTHAFVSTFALSQSAYDKDNNKDTECVNKHTFNLKMSCGHSLCINCMQTMNNYLYDKCPFCNTNVNLNPVYIRKFIVKWKSE